MWGRSTWCARARGTGRGASLREWYRVRWQIELTFKRFKSLAQLGHLPKYDDQSSRAWLYGKLLVALLTQKSVRVGRELSPGVTFSRDTLQRSEWREFGLALHQIQNAIEPSLPPTQVLHGWNRLAAALAEGHRKRTVQDRSLN
jgi:hypothetical protein